MSRSADSTLPKSSSAAKGEDISGKPQRSLSVATNDDRHDVTSHSEDSTPLLKEASVTTADVAAPDTNFAISRPSPLIIAGKSPYLSKAQSKKLYLQSQKPVNEVETVLQSQCGVVDFGRGKKYLSHPTVPPVSRKKSSNEAAGRRLEARGS